MKTFIKAEHRILSALLAIFMVVGMMPTAAFAEQGAPFADTQTVTAVADLDSTSQELTVGSSDKPTLPQTLSATLTTTSWVEAETEPTEGESSTEPDGTQTTWQSVTVTEDVNLDLAWSLSDDVTFSTDSEGDYIFTASVTGDYADITLAEDVTLPQYSVTVVTPVVDPATAPTPTITTTPAPIDTPTLSPAPVVNLSQNRSGGVDYIDASGQLMNTGSELVTSVVDGGTNVGMSAGWYQVKPTDGSGVITFTGTLTIDGDVHLILGDSFTLGFNNIVVSDGGSLTVYAQSTGDNMGALNVNATEGIGIDAVGGKDILASYAGGNLTINGGRVSVTSADSRGIFVKGNLIVNGGVVSSTTTSTGTNNHYAFAVYGESHSITINGGTVNATTGSSSDGSGFFADGNNASINITGGAVNVNTQGAPGIQAVTFNSENSNIDINISGGTVEVTTTGDNAYGIVAHATSGGNDSDINISGDANVTVTTSGANAHGIYDAEVDGDINIRDTADVTVTTSGASANGIYTLNSFGDVNISGGGTVTVIGGKSGIYSTGGLSISWGTVNATGGESGIYTKSTLDIRNSAEVSSSGTEYGLYSSKLIEIIDTAKVTATANAVADDNATNSDGIYAATGFFIQNSAQVVASGGVASSTAHGIRVGTSGDIHMDGGTLTATGGTVGGNAAYALSEDPIYADNYYLKITTGLSESGAAEYYGAVQQYQQYVKIEKLPVPTVAESFQYHIGDGVNVTFTIMDGGNTLQVGDGTNAAIDTATSGNIQIPNSITFPNNSVYNVTSIGKNAFRNCLDLTSVTIPDSVTSIGDSAFQGCLDLVSVTIPDSVTSIGTFAFFDCLELTAINVEENNANYSSTDGVLFNADKTKLIRHPEGKEGTYTVPDSVTSIDHNAFYNSSGLTSITIPKSVTSIGDNAFFSCSGLTTLNVDEDNTAYASDGSGVLYNADLTTLIKFLEGRTGTYAIPDGVTTVEEFAFYDSGVTSISVPKSVTEVGINAFGYSDLTSIYFDGDYPTTDDGINTIPEAATVGYNGDATGWNDVAGALPVTVKLGSALEHTGSELTQTVDSVVIGTAETIDSNGFNLSNNTATDAGIHTLTVTLTGDKPFVITKNFKISLPKLNDVTYRDENGIEKTSDNVTQIDSYTTELSAGWYIVNSAVTLTSELTFTGDVHLILADGGSLNIASTPHSIECKNDSDSLTIYGQENGTGSLTATATDASTNGIYGGSVTINGGIVSATGSVNGIRAGKLTINNGVVSASGGEGGKGISADTITFAVGVQYATSTDVIADDASYSSGDDVSNSDMERYVKVREITTSWADHTEPVAEVDGVYTITTPEQLAWVAKYVNDGNKTNITNFKGKTIKLANTIDLSAHEWVPIGWSRNIPGKGFDASAFSGTFDGGNNEITGLYINTPDAENVGLFGYTFESTIKNVGVSGSITAYHKVGGVVGFANNESVITDCYSTVDITSNNGIDFGGVVGENNGLINRCYYDGTITGVQNNGGGVAGSSSSGMIINSYNLGNITGDSSIGGVVGHSSTTIINCYNAGLITAAADGWVGGVVGHNYLSVINSYNIGTVSASGNSVGGVVGHNTVDDDRNLLIQNSYYLAQNDVIMSGVGSTKDIEGTLTITNVGSFSDANSAITWDTDTHDGSTNYSDLITALNAGNRTYNGTVTENYASEWLSDNATTPTNSGYPVLGSVHWGIFADDGGLDWTETEITIDTAAELAYFASLVNSGNNFNNKTITLGDTIDISAHEWMPIGIGVNPINSRDNYFGGTFDGDGYEITGLNVNMPETDKVGLFGVVGSAVVKNLGVSGTVIGKDYVGGVVGDLYSTDLVNCYFNGSVEGEARVGGLAGKSDADGGSTSTVMNSYSKGSVTGVDIVGGIVGENYGDVRNSYSASAINAPNLAGGLVGVNSSTVESSGNVRYCYSLEDSGAESLISQNSGNANHDNNSRFDTNMIIISGFYADNTLKNALNHSAWLYNNNDTTPDVLAKGWDVTGADYPAHSDKAIRPSDPVITVQPEDAVYPPKMKADELSVAVQAPTDGGTLSYQWYSNTKNSSADAVLIQGETAATYTPSTDTTGVTYYYCVVKSTISDALFDQTAQTTTDIVTIIISEPGVMLSNNQVIVTGNGMVDNITATAVGNAINDVTENVTWHLSKTQDGEAMNQAELLAAGLALNNNVISIGNKAKDDTYYMVAVGGADEFHTGESTKSASFTIDREDSVVAKVTVGEGFDSIAVPTVADGGTIDGTAFAATVSDQYDDTMDGQTVTWSMTTTNGVNINESTGVVSVTKDAAAVASVTVTATVNGNVTGTKTFEITKAAATLALMELFVDNNEVGKDNEGRYIDIIVKPASATVGNATKTYTVKGYDQFGAEMATAPSVTWDLVEPESSVSQTDGTVSVTYITAVNNSYTLTATSGSVNAKVTITIKDIEITAPTVDKKANPIYGDTWGDIITLTGGEAILLGVNIPGKFSVADKDSVPNSGVQTFKVLFNSNNAKYVDVPVDITENTVDIAKVDIESAVVTLDENEFTYDTTGQTPTVSVTLNGSVVDASEYDISYSNTNGGEGNTTNAGTITVTVTAKADGNYSGTVAQTPTYVIKKADQENFAITEVTSKKYGDSPFDLVTTGGNGTGAVSYEVAIGGVLAVIDNTATITGVGTVTVKATKAGDDNYNATTAATDITITKGDAPILVLPTASDIIYGQKLSDSILSKTNDEYGTYAWKDGSIIPESGDAPQEIIFTQTNDNYESVQQTTIAIPLTVEIAVPTVRVRVDISGESGNRTATLTATVSKVGEGAIPTGTVTFTNPNGASGVVVLATKALEADGTAVYEWTGLTDGAYVITTTYNGSDDYSAIALSEQKFNTAKQSQTGFTLSPIGHKTYGDDTFELSYSGGSGTGEVTFESLYPNVISINGTTATIHKAGVAQIVVTKDEDDDYNNAVDQIIFTVSKKTLTVTAHDKTIVEGEDLPLLTFSSDGLVGSDVFTVDPTVSSPNANKDIPRDYTITVSGGTLTNADSYNVSYVSGTLSVKEQTYAVMIKDGGTGASGGAEYIKGATVTINAGSRSNYSFSGWTVTSGDVILSNANSKTTTFIMPPNAVTVTATWSYIGGSSGGGSYDDSDSDGSEVQRPVTSGGEANVNIETKPNTTGGNSKADIPDSIVEDAVKDALNEAKGTDNAPKVTLVIDTPRSADSVEVKFDSSALKDLAANNNAVFEIKSDVGTATFNSDSLSSMLAQASGRDVTIVIREAEGLTELQKSAIGSRPAFEMLIEVGNSVITSFNGGITTVTVPYTLASGEKAEEVAVYQIDANGKMTLKPTSYNAVTREVTFTTAYISAFMVGTADKFNPGTGSVL